MSTPAFGLAKLDAFLTLAVSEHRAGLLRIILKLADGVGAESRVCQLLACRNRAIDKVLMEGRLIVSTVEGDDLCELAASDDVERISLDAVVSTGGAGT